MSERGHYCAWSERDLLDEEKMDIGVTGPDGYSIPFDFISFLTGNFGITRYRRVTLKEHWWSQSMPSERIREIVTKAQRYADKMNHREMYIDHEAELVERKP